MTANTKSEPLFLVEQRGDKYFITGFTEWDIAEQNNLRHLTVIIVSFVADGKEKGKWVVHDRTQRQWARGLPDCKNLSYNFFGGHCTADLSRVDLIGAEVPQEICDFTARRELEEELLCHGNEIELEKWEGRQKRVENVTAGFYHAKEPIPIGFSSFSGIGNLEISYIYALPIPEADLPKLVASDSYMLDGKEHSVCLPIVTVSESELKEMHARSEETNVEICDAVTRLWLPENAGVYKKLKRVIEAYP